MSSFNNNNNTTDTNLDDLFLRTLLGRLQIQPSPPISHQSLEDLLFNAATENLSESDDENPSQTQLAREESKLEKEIIRIIISGQTDLLKPNSGQAVTVNEHHICVGFHEDEESDYRVWEWHGHIMLFDEENGYSPEYIYGNYFERLPLQLVRDKKEKVVTEEEKVENLGLRELIDGAGSGQGRILHRNVIPGSKRV